METVRFFYLQKFFYFKCDLIGEWKSWWWVENWPFVLNLKHISIFCTILIFFISKINIISPQQKGWMWLNTHSLGTSGIDSFNLEHPKLSVPCHLLRVPAAVCNALTATGHTRESSFPPPYGKAFVCFSPGQNLGNKLPQEVSINCSPNQICNASELIYQCYGKKSHGIQNWQCVPKWNPICECFWELGIQLPCHCFSECFYMI